MRYQQANPGDWGQMQGTADITTATEKLTTADGCELFLRSWKTNGPDVLLILHGLGGHSGWYIDMGNELASRGISVYAMDHRGFGRSAGYDHDSQFEKDRSEMDDDLVPWMREITISPTT